jgi:hypothetical protein
VNSQEAVRVYARRFGRRMLMTKLCGSDQDHPAMVVESQLVEMALSSLMESILATNADNNLIVEGVRFWVADWLYHSVEDDEMRSNLLQELSAMDANTIVPRNPESKPSGS